MVEINLESALSLVGALEISNKLQVFFKTNDAQRVVLGTVLLLTKKIEQMRRSIKKKMTIIDFLK